MKKHCNFKLRQSLKILKAKYLCMSTYTGKQIWCYKHVINVCIISTFSLVISGCGTLYEPVDWTDSDYVESGVKTTIDEFRKFVRYRGQNLHQIYKAFEYDYEWLYIRAHRNQDSKKVDFQIYVSPRFNCLTQHSINQEGKP